MFLAIQLFGLGIGGCITIYDPEHDHEGSSPPWNTCGVFNTPDNKTRVMLFTNASVKPRASCNGCVPFHVIVLNIT